MNQEKGCNAEQPGERSPARTDEQHAEIESPPSYDSAELLKGSQEILIRHHGEVYRLRLTRNDKLILHK